MAGNLTDTAEVEALKWLCGQTATAPVAPLKVRLMTANGTDATAGTEVTGSAYAPLTVTFAAPSAGATSNTATLSWTSLDASASKTVVGVEVWDSAATPVRWWYGALTTSKTVAAGAPCEIAVGDLDLTLD